MPERKSSIILDKTQPVFMGIDVHKKKWSVCFVHCEEMIGRFTISGNFKKLEKLLERYKGMKVKSVYEAGFSGFHLHYQLTKKGIENIITPPNKIPVLTGDKVKTDKRDSYKLANYLSKGLLKAINIPTPELINLRQLLRTRNQIKNKRIRVINQLKMLLIQHGIIFEDLSGMPKYMRDEIKTWKLPSMIKLSVGSYIEEIEFFEKQMKQYDKNYKKGPEDKTLRKNWELLLSVYGIGELIATALTYEIGDWKRFNNEGEISAYFGLTPSEYSSGEHINKGRITGQGNSWLRSLLIEASWMLISKDNEMRIFYEKLKIKKGGKRAIVAVSRKLLCRLYSMIKNQKEYIYKQAA